LSHNGQLKFSVLYDFLNVLSDSQVMQKTSDKDYIWTVSLLHEFLNVLSDCHVLKKILVKEYNWMVSLMWILSRDESLKDLSHNEHLKCLSEWTIKRYLRMSDVGKDLMYWNQKWRFSLKLIRL
jgi:hypothetical protein